VTVVQKLADGLVNFASRLGTSSDKATFDTYARPVITQQEIDNAYRTSWFRKIVDVPPFDEVREWRTWQADTGTETKPIEDEENRHNLRRKIFLARCKARKDGGAILYMGGLPGDANTPLEVNRISKGALKYVTVFSKYEINPTARDNDPLSPSFNQATMYTLGGATTDIHPSRCILFLGPEKPEQEAWDGWGDSLWMSMKSVVTNSDLAATGVASLIHEAKIDVISVPGLMKKIQTTEYESQLTRRFQIANFLKSINNMLLIDGGNEEGKGGETFEQKTLNFAGFPEIMDRMDIRMSGMADIPATRLLGRHPAGLNATGEFDLRNYYDRIKSGQELDLTPSLIPMDEVIIRSAIGSRPANIYYEWNPLYSLSEIEAATTEKSFADAFKVRVDSATIDETVLGKAELNRMIESGRYPGIEAAILDSQTDGGVKDPADIAAAAAMQTAANNPVIKDSAPRTLYVRRDVVNVAEITKWASAQGFTDIVPDLHVTIAYSRTPVDWFAVGQSWSPKLEIPAGGPRQMDALGPEKKYMALLITATELVWRNREIIEAGASWEWSEYQPHISIQIGGNLDLSKVEPYQGRIVLGPEVFSEVKED
jgi:uncharacterized protein